MPRKIPDSMILTYKTLKPYKRGGNHIETKKDIEDLEKELKKIRKKESKKDRAIRKYIWMQKATAHFDSKAIRKEASDKFEKFNK